MAECLSEEGFDYARPDVNVAWRAFKRFLDRPLDEGTYTVGFELEHVWDRDTTLFLEFVRELGEEDGTRGRVGCGFSCEVPAKLWGVHASHWWWAEHGTLSEWLAQVETDEAFIAATRVRSWRWEGFGL
jgi:hypothetical protein